MPFTVSFKVVYGLSSSTNAMGTDRFPRFEGLVIAYQGVSYLWEETPSLWSPGTIQPAWEAVSTQGIWSLGTIQPTWTIGDRPVRPRSKWITKPLPPFVVFSALHFPNHGMAIHSSDHPMLIAIRRRMGAFA